MIGAISISLLVIGGLCVGAESGSGQVALTDLECPLPDGAQSGNPEICGKYSACGWGNNRCVLNDQVGYTVVKNGPSRTLRLEKKSDVTMFGSDVLELEGVITKYDRSRMGIAVRDPKTKRYEVPLDLNLPTEQQLPEEFGDAGKYEYSSSHDQLSNGDDFGISVLNKGRASLRMLPTFIYSDQFIEATFLIGSDDIYGFGENNHDTFRHDLDAGKTWPMFAVDRPPEYGNENLYGVHPFFLAIEDDLGVSFGMLLLNSNAMEYKLFKLNGSAALTFRTTGGILDLYIFFGNSPSDVIKQYHKTIGLPVMPPFWGLGFQLSRFGYKGTDDIRAIHARNKAAGVPQDVQYSDIDYMNNRKDFTIDPSNFGDLAQMVADFREKEGVRMAFIYDPAIAIYFGTYGTVDRGVKKDVFTRWWNESFVPGDQCRGCRDYVVGYVWPRNKTLFPDFFQQNTVDWWTDEVKRFVKLAGEPEGFWIDMNEPSNFGTNLDKPFNWPKNKPAWSLKCPHNNLEDPPYPTMWTNRDPSNESKRISDKTICMSAKHVNDVFGKKTMTRTAKEDRSVAKYSWLLDLLHHPRGKFTRTSPEIPRNPPRAEVAHYNVHSLYGWSEFHATRVAMNAALGGRRGLLVGRSTFPGSGRWGAHWTGDNTARWGDMKRSIIGMLEFNIFGIPFVGADICGFNGNTTESLCLRWMQLGAFYPFCRNHNTDDGVDQDPAAWPSVAAASRDALGMRYRLLSYLYTSLYHSSTYGGSVVRPLAFEFPNVTELRGLDTQFLLGGGVMVAPVLDENKMTEVDVTFPPGGWFDLRDGSRASSGSQVVTKHYNVAMNQMIPVFVREGTIVPMQKNETTTRDTRKNPFYLSVFGTKARGELFWDDGESLDTVKNSRYYSSFFDMSDGVLRITVSKPQMQWMEKPWIETVIFYGLPAAPKSVNVDGKPVSKDSIHFNNGILTIDVHLDMANDHIIALND